MITIVQYLNNKATAPRLARGISAAFGLVLSTVLWWWVILGGAAAWAVLDDATTLNATVAVPILAALGLSLVGLGTMIGYRLGVRAGCADYSGRWDARWPDGDPAEFFHAADEDPEYVWVQP